MGIKKMFTKTFPRGFLGKLRGLKNMGKSMGKRSESANKEDLLWKSRS
ncbi:hypothetical protein [Brotaphodocola sp.]